MADEEKPVLSEAQTEIMKVVWERGEVTLRDVCKALPPHRQVAANTVQTLLTRLAEKGWLARRAEGKIFHYRATSPRETGLKQIVRRVVDSAFGGSQEELVLALLQGEQLSKEEADRIRQLIERAEKGEL
jgi:BlaI family transcriptional regulator, penicillinase repressor